MKSKNSILAFAPISIPLFVLLALLVHRLIKYGHDLYVTNTQYGWYFRE